MVLQYDGSDNKMKVWGQKVTGTHIRTAHLTIERNSGDIAIGPTIDRTGRIQTLCGWTDHL